MVEEPGHARLDLEVEVVDVRRVEVRRERVGEDPRVPGLAYDRAELAGLGRLRVGYVGAARLVADLAAKML